MGIKSNVAAILVAGGMVMGLSGCENADDADLASYNISKAADNFEVDRRIVFYNGITEQIMLEIVGKCSMGSGKSSESITVTCKDGEGSYKKHQLGLSDNVTYFSQQLESVGVNVYNYRYTIKPEVVIPDFDLRTSK